MMQREASWDVTTGQWGLVDVGQASLANTLIIHPREV